MRLATEKQTMLYYLVPRAVKRLGRAAKRISSRGPEREASKFRRDRRLINQRFATSDAYNSWLQELFPTLDNDPLQVIIRKAEDLKELVLSSGRESALQLRSLDPLSGARSDTVKSLLASCELKCHELLTHLANIDWELYELEQSLEPINLNINRAA